MLAKEACLGVFINREIHVLQIRAAQEIPRLVPESPGYPELRDEFLARYEARMTRETRVFDDMVPVLAWLEGEGLPEEGTEEDVGHKVFSVPDGGSTPPMGMDRLSEGPTAPSRG